MKWELFDNLDELRKSLSLVIALEIAVSCTI